MQLISAPVPRNHELSHRTHSEYWKEKGAVKDETGIQNDIHVEKTGMQSKRNPLVKNLPIQQLSAHIDSKK